VLRYEFGFGHVPNMVIEAAGGGSRDGADGFGGFAAISEGERGLEQPGDAGHRVEILRGDRPRIDQLGGVAVLLEVFQGGPQKFRSHGGGGIQFDVEAARDLEGGAGLPDLLVDLFGLVEPFDGGRDGDGVAA
jgi:hypothetical protein